MQLFIEDNILVEDVKTIFTNYYPFLKIELYKKPYITKHHKIKKELLASASYLNKYTQVPRKTVINIDNCITVSELENQFAAIGLAAEVFRKSGNVWIETSLTDNWTLQQQNMEGEEISRHYNDKKITLSNT
jgi:hypothetical protein